MCLNSLVKYFYKKINFNFNFYVKITLGFQIKVFIN